MSVPQNIQELANKVRNEIYGRDVRESIAKSMEATGEVAEWSRQVAQDIVDGKFDEGELATEIERKLNELEVEYAPRLNSVDQQLAQKRDKSVPVGLNDIDSDLATAIQGGTPVEVLSIPRPDSVTMDTISFRKKSTNLFNLNDYKDDFFVDRWTGELTADDNYIASGYIEVVPETSIIIKQVAYYAFYDVDKNRIAGNVAQDPFQNIILTVPTNAIYIRFSWAKSTGIDNTNQQMNLGNTLLPYEPWYEVISKDYVEKHPFEPSDIPEGAIDYTKTSFINHGKNHFNKETLITGYYVDENNGVLRTNSNHDTSDLMDIEPNKNFVVSPDVSSLRVVYYDENEVYIEGYYQPTMPLTSPQNARFMRISFWGNPNTVQVEKGTSATSYEPFGFIIPNLLNETSKTPVILNLPSKIYGLVGQELNVYFDNIINGKDTDYDFDVVGWNGKQLQNFWRFVPSTAGQFSLTFNVYKDNTIVASKVVNVIVSGANVGSGATKKILKIGDSTTDNGNGINKLLENFSGDVMDIESIGTRGTSPNLHEGRSGWTATDYTTLSERSGVPNAFWNPTTSKFDFSYYMTQNAFSIPDYVFINLGINDMFNFENDETLNQGIVDTIAKYEEMITSIHVYNANVKIALGLTIPPNYSQDAFGKAYNSTVTRTRYKRNHDLWVNELIKEFDSRESENIFLVPIHTNLDTRYNMGLEETPVNARNSLTYSSPIGNGGVHPVTSGYWQIADVEWYFLKSFES